MAPNLLISTVDLLSALATAALAIATAKPCRASGVAYLLAIPVGFGLITVAFSVQLISSWIVPDFASLGLPLGVVYLLMQTYGLRFLAVAYARRTRLRVIGESTSVELVAAIIITIVMFQSAFASPLLPHYLVPTNA
jgi:hypothetical protein